MFFFVGKINMHVSFLPQVDHLHEVLQLAIREGKKGHNCGITGNVREIYNPGSFYERICSLRVNVTAVTSPGPQPTTKSLLYTHCSLPMFSVNTRAAVQWAEDR